MNAADRSLPVSATAAATGPPSTPIRLAIAAVVNSGATAGRKLLWIAIIVLLPVIGFVLWYLMGPKAGRA